MCRVSTMSTLKACSAVLAAILVLANTSTAQDFLNERPESNYDYPGFFNRPGTPPPRRPWPNPEPEFNADPFWRYPKLYGPRSFRPTPKPPGMGGSERGDPLSSMLRTLQDGGEGEAGGAGGSGGGQQQQQVKLMHHITLFT